MSAATGRDQCLDAARVAVVERAGAYGSPAPFFAAVARRWSLTLGVDITASQVVLCLIDMKQQRAVNGGGLDTFADLAGYAAIGFELEGYEPASMGRDIATVQSHARDQVGTVYSVALLHPIETVKAHELMVKAFARLERHEGIKLSAPSIWPDTVRDLQRVFYAEAVVIGDAG